MIIVRTDLFQDRKGVHIKVDKAVHAALRAQMFRYNISMQEVFNEFANLIVNEHGPALRIVENLVMRKVREKIEGKATKRHCDNVSEMDHDVLYQLIDEK